VIKDKIMFQHPGKDLLPYQEVKKQKLVKPNEIFVDISFMLEYNYSAISILTVSNTSSVPNCRSFGISRFTFFVMHLDIYNILVSRYIITTMNLDLDLPKRPTIWNGGSINYCLLTILLVKCLASL
jgi:hypothetical protein